MRRSVLRAVRGLLAGVACLAFVALFFLARTGGSLTAVAALAAVGLACLAAAAGPSAVLQLVGVRGVDPTASESDAPDSDAGSSSTADTDWWLARVEPVLENVWNRWSDAVLVVGLGALGVGSFVLLATHPGDDPPVGLLIVGFLGINGALIVLAVALR